MQLSDADRDWLLSALSRHSAEGRLELDELERRVETVMAAQTREEAGAVLADLPPLPEEASPQRPRWGRGHGDVDQPAPHWRPTGERFRDPKSGRVMRVWLDSEGGRHYVPDGQGPDQRR